MGGAVKKRTFAVTGAGAASRKAGEKAPRGWRKIEPGHLARKLNRQGAPVAVTRQTSEDELPPGADDAVTNEGKFGTVCYVRDGRGAGHGMA